MLPLPLPLPLELELALVVLTLERVSVLLELGVPRSGLRPNMRAAIS